MTRTGEGEGDGARGKGDVGAATEAVRRRLGKLKPRVAIVLGSGMGSLADEVAYSDRMTLPVLPLRDAVSTGVAVAQQENVDPVSPGVLSTTRTVRIPYSTIPGFPEPGVAGHKGELLAGTLEGVPVIVQAGRFHLYEGHSAATAGLPARVFGELGVEILIVTNAAGGVRRTFQGGTLMLIADHINLMWRNPLAGPAQPGEQRFPIMHDPYDRDLRDLARTVARDQGIALEEGVYAALLGPSYETPTEVRMLERLGADAVGMSTVPEVLIARSRGMRCLGFSIITNPGAGITSEALSHEDVLAVSQQVARRLSVLLKGILGRLTLG